MLSDIFPLGAGAWSLATAAGPSSKGATMAVL